MQQGKPAAEIVAMKRSGGEESASWKAMEGDGGNEHFMSGM